LTIIENPLKINENLSKTIEIIENPWKINKNQ